ncbi:helix-turn-helix transcriptional regulator [Psychrobacter sp. NPDC078370]|uniref:helix-turn-helix transcriptional regulator n=1 Tax=unclassified Psychrobacter TaxID=196806 RepID=UPI000C7E9CF2|nr:WYL domain-containing protein [Psychrobacter sp. MES7-P7E]PLT23648.1 WYL domain-containing protein [Psychrobacter sp. MES7-P7E]|tara:strand:+ start:3452 stop:4540 length:1089 start_codon:yes stop_codon:yes gene_type:complete
MPAHQIASYTKSARLFALYQSLPRSEADAMSLTELMQNYGDNTDNYTNERKNLENDLIGLNQIFNDIFYSDALVRVPAWGNNISGKTARFYIDPSFSIDVINEQTVFFWEMLDKYTANYLPVSFKQEIADKLTQLRRQDKDKFHQSPLGQWPDHLITLPSIVQAPTLDSDVLESIHQALLQNRQLRISYQNKWDEKPVQRVIYPKGLIFIDNMIYLTGFNSADDHIDDDVLLKEHRNFAVNRITEAIVIDKPIPDWVGRDVFTLNSLQKLGKLEFGKNVEINLVLKVQKFACQHLYERPLSTDQKITIIDDTWNQVSATVANTTRLQDWLVSMSQLAVVVEPVDLKAVILDRLHSALVLYEK